MGPAMRMMFGVFFVLVPGYVGYVAYTQKDPLVEFGIMEPSNDDDMGAWNAVFGKKEAIAPGSGKETGSAQ